MLFGCTIVTEKVNSERQYFDLTWENFPDIQLLDDWYDNFSYNGRYLFTEPDGHKWISRDVADTRYLFFCGKRAMGISHPNICRNLILKTNVPCPKLGHDTKKEELSMERPNLTDEELKKMDIKIPDDETDGSFFDWIEDMIQEEFKDVPKE